MEKTQDELNDLKKKTEIALSDSKENATSSRADEIVELMENRKNEFEEVLQNTMTKERFLRLALSSFRANPKLMQCSKPSLVNAFLSAAAMGVEPNTPLGEAFLIPRKNKAGQLEANFQLGYKGLLTLARRSGKIISIHADVVFDGDTYDSQHGSQPMLIHKPTRERESRGSVVCYYACAHLVGGGFQFVEMLPFEIEERRQRAASSSATSPWDTDYQAMAIKTVLIELCKFLPRTPALSYATSNDYEQQDQ